MTENRNEAETTAYQQEKNKDINHVLDQVNFSRMNERESYINNNRIKQLASIRERVKQYDEY